MDRRVLRECTSTLRESQCLRVSVFQCLKWLETTENAVTQHNTEIFVGDVFVDEISDIISRFLGDTQFVSLRGWGTRILMDGITSTAVLWFWGCDGNHGMTALFIWFWTIGLRVGVSNEIPFRIWDSNSLRIDLMAIFVIPSIRWIRWFCWFVVCHLVSVWNQQKCHRDSREGLYLTDYSMSHSVCLRVESVDEDEKAETVPFHWGFGSDQISMALRLWQEVWTEATYYRRHWPRDRTGSGRDYWDCPRRRGRYHRMQSYRQTDCRTVDCCCCCCCHCCHCGSVPVWVWVVVGAAERTEQRNQRVMPLQSRVHCQNVRIELNIRRIYKVRCDWWWVQLGTNYKTNLPWYGQTWWIENCFTLTRYLHFKWSQLQSLQIERQHWIWMFPVFVRIGEWI